MKLWLDNILKPIVSAFSCLTILLCSALNCTADDIDPTDISYVSVNPYTNEVVVSWYKSESANIKFTRILYIYEKSTLVKGNGIVDIPGNDDKTFVFKTDTVSQFTFDANEKPITLAVDAYSENGSNSTSLREYHTTMIASAKITSCPSQIKISWTAYSGYGITVDKYEIIESSNGTETVVKECNADEFTCLLELNEHQDRNFFVRATFTDCRGIKRTSTSCMCEVSQKAYVYPKFLEIEALHVENHDITVVCRCDVASDFRTYYLYKTTSDAENVLLETFTLSSESTGKHEYLDKNAFETTPDISYQVVVLNNCNDTILIGGAQPDIPRICDYEKTRQTISWSNHGDSVSFYRLWRSINDKPEELIATMENKSNFIGYDDDISNILEINTTLYICYRVETLYKTGTTSFTYKSCIEKSNFIDYKLLIPNAINPYSEIEENRIFKPKYAFLSGDYTLEVYNRFGALIFTSNDIDVGWDGTIKGEIAPTGTYQYKIVITNAPNSAQPIIRYGVVNLIYKFTE